MAPATAKPAVAVTHLLLSSSDYSYTLAHIGRSRLNVLYGLSVPVALSAPHRAFSVVAVKMPALVAEVTDLGNVANFSRGEVAGPKLTTPNAGIAFAPITTHSGGRAGEGGGISSGSSWNASNPFFVFPTNRNPAFSYV